MSLAVVGTDTGVGKTVVSALLLARYGRREEARDTTNRRDRRPAAAPRGGMESREPAFPDIAYWKPVSTGAERDRDAAFIRTRVGDLALVLEEEYRFNRPVSPHLAARMAGEEIDLARLLTAWERHSSVPDRALVVEGIGGLLVPLNDRGDLLADLIALFKIPAALVARTALGTINHTLLSLEAMRAREIEIAGVILDGSPSPENAEAIQRFGKVEVAAEVPPLVGGENPSRAAILTAAQTFDGRGILGRFLAGEGRHGKKTGASA